MHADGTINPEGQEYYTNFIEGLIAANIKPALTIYHWDLPQVFQAEFEGWYDEKIIDHFVHYATVCFELWGEHVETWITFNEPSVFVLNGMEWGDMAPNFNDIDSRDSTSEIRAYWAAKNIILAHGKAYRKYKEMGLTGQIGITLNSNWDYIRNPYKAVDYLASERSVAFYWFGV